MVDDATLALRSMLVSMLPENDTVFFVPHNRPDFDTLGALIALADLVNTRFGKKVHIIINDDRDNMESKARYIIDTISDRFSIITLKDLPNLLTDKSLLIVTDANTGDRISVKDNLNLFHDVLIIDHHSEGENTIKTDKKFIDDTVSSTCEIVAKLLYSLNFKTIPIYLDYLYAGIVLDTNHFTKNINSLTFNIAGKLVEDGADPTRVNALFTEDPIRDKKILELISKANIVQLLINMAITSNNIIYEPEDLAKAAGHLLVWGTDVTFALGYISENIVGISARSKGRINILPIIKCFGGGGHEDAAAASITFESLKKIRKNVGVDENTPLKSTLLEEVELLLTTYMMSGNFIYPKVTENVKKGGKTYVKE